MNRLMAVAILTMFAGGCANQQLRFSTLRQTSTLPDVQQRQAMENFARLASNPGGLPYFAVANQGTASVTDGGATGLGINAVSRAFPSWNISAVGANRTITENWTLVPENNPDRLRAMRAAYLTVLGVPEIDERDAALLHSVIRANPAYEIHAGWVCTGSWLDVPRNAWLVARAGSTCAWVMPENAAEFSRFVLLILHIETVKPSSPAPSFPTSAAPTDEFTLPAPIQGSPFESRLFDVPPGVNSGLFFIPRP